MLAARLRAYVPGGAALQQMPEPLQWSAMVARNDIGSLTLTYTSVAAGGEVVERALTDGVEIAVEVTDGTADAFGVTVWTEPRGCRFVMIERGRDIADPTKSISLTLPSYAWLLSKARNYTTAVYPPEHAQAGKRGWVAPTAGEILADLIAENTARGGYAAQVAPVFSATLDAAGAPWPTIPNQAFDLGTDYASILDSLTAAGALDWQTQARGLYAWLPDSSALSPDLTTGTTLLLDGVSPGRASTPDTAALDIVGDIDVRVHVAMDDWTPTETKILVGKTVATGNQISWRLGVTTTGTLRMTWTTGGVTAINADSTVAPTVANGAALWVRATLDVNNGASGRDVTFYTSVDGEVWTQLGSTITQAGVTSIFSGTAEVAVSGLNNGTANRLAGKVYSAQIRSGINGAIVANPQFDAQPPGTTSFADSTGLTWTVTAPASIVETGTAPLTLHHKHVGSMPTSESIADMVGRMYVRTDAGGVAVATDPAVVGPWGVPEGFLQVGSVADESAAVAVGEAELERVGKVRGQYTRDLVLTDDAPAPLLDYWPGCWIKAPGAGGALERLRVQSVTLTKDANGLGGSAVLNDRIVASDERRARNLSALAGGGTISPGGPPAPIAVDPEASRVPSTPTGLDATATLVFESGEPRGIVTATWNPVTTATDSGALTIAGYELQYRIGAGDWQTIVTPEVSAEITGLNPGAAVDTRVRAVGARTTLPSAWSSIDSVTVSGDTTAPSVPSAPTVVARLGVVTVTWDGLTSVGGTMEEDFARVEIAMGDTATPTVVVGNLTRAGSFPVTGQTYGELRQVRLRAVDTSGNASAWSDVSDPIAVVGVAGPDLEANSVTANAIEAGSITGELLAGELVIGNLFTTSADGTGQRVELDPAGLRMINAADEVRINLPTADDEDPTVRARIQADGLTVYEGATFYSTLNEFARDSEINLAEQVAGPLAGPVPTFTWEGVSLERTAYSDVLGNFALEPTEVVGVGRDFRSGATRILVMQKRPGGTRIWFYDMDGGLSDLTVGGFPQPYQDWRDFEITGGVYKDVDSVWFGKWSVNNEWYFLRNGTVFHRYPSANPSTRNTMGWNGTDYLVAEKISTTGYRFRRMDVSGSGDATVLENVNSTGLSPLTPGLAFIFKGSADFGSTKWVVSHQDVNTFRTFTSAGAWDPDYRWDPPAQKVGGFWNAADSLFYTIGADGILYKHTSLNWTDSTLDTWHVGQSFYDSNATGGTHETALGTITSFTMKKRARVRFSLADVPYAGGTDDPNQWRLYAKRGAAPLTNLSDMKLQASGSYTEKTYLMAYVPTTGGTAALQFGTFPNASPAKLYSGRTFAGDPTKHIFEVRGDGSGHWGTFEVSSTGVISNTDDIDWTTLPLVSATAIAGYTPQYCRINGIVYLRGRMSSVDNVNNTVIATLPAGCRPDTAIAQQELGVFRTAGAIFAALFVETSTGEIKTSATFNGTDTDRFLGGSFPAGS